MFETLITFQARQQPDAVAIHTPVGDVTYAELNADVDRMARYLMSVLPAERSRIAVQVQNPGLHWVVLLALARLGHASASLPPVTERPREQLLSLLKPVLLLCEDGPTSADASVFHLSPERVAEALAADASPVTPYRFGKDEPVRVLLSSGTTGTPKTTVWTRGVLDIRLQLGALLSSVIGTRGLIQQGLDSDPGFRAPLVHWSLGGTIVYTRAQLDWAEVFTVQRPSCVTMAPAHLARLLQALPGDFPLQPDLSIVLGGGALPQALSARARARLTPNIYVTYGSTEAGFVAIAPAQRLEGRPGAVGFVTPWAEVEIVDEAGAPVEPGRAGRIRMRSEEMAASYEDDPALSRASFQDGWFYPGDLGLMEADGCLVVQGRVSEVMDINGFKLAPSAVEEVVLACAGVRDAAAVALTRPDGLTNAVVALVVGEAYRAEAVAARLREQFPQVRFELAEVAAIAHSERGKIQRDQLRAALLARMSSGKRANVWRA